MSLRSKATQVAAAAAATAAAALACAAPSQAASVDLTYQCKFPLVGAGEVALKLSVTPPDVVVFDRATARLSGARLEQLTSSVGGGTLSGDVIVRYGTHPETGEPESIKSTLQIGPPSLGAPGITATGGYPGPNTGEVTVDRLTLALKINDASGAPVKAPAPIEEPGYYYADVEQDPYVFNVVCRLQPDTQDTTLFASEEPDLDTTAPSVPTNGSTTWPVCGARPTSATISWSPSVDEAGGSGLAKYRVNYRGQNVFVSGDKSSVLLTGLDAAGPGPVSVTAIDVAGNESAALVIQQPVAVCIPPEPGGLVCVPKVNSVTLSWRVPTDPETPIKAYNVYNGATRAATTTGTSVTINGLTPDTAYRFSIEAVDANGNVGPKSPEVACKTTVIVDDFFDDFDLAGSATLKTLVTGSLPLKGTLHTGTPIVQGGAFSGDLAIADTQGRLIALGFLPVTAKIGFVSSGATTGALNHGVLTTSSQVRIKVKEAKLFGAIPLVAGNTCQTKSLSKIDLASTVPFSPSTGGTVAGTFAISDLNGCGALNGLVSPLAAGTGNQISLKLTPKA